MSRLGIYGGLNPGIAAGDTASLDSSPSHGDCGSVGDPVSGADNRPQ